MAGRLAGRVAIVTGAGQGIGRGIALALAAEGAGVVLAGRTFGKVENVAGEIETRGGSALALECDVTARASVDAMVATTVERFGRVDILVNNAQDSLQKLLEETTVEDLERCWSTGTLGTFHCMQACLPHLKESHGNVVNFGSSTALRGDHTFGAYAMAKEAIRALTRTAANEWGRFGIRVNSICPAAMSPSAEEWSKAHPERFAVVLKGIPLGRFGDAEQDIGRAVVALVSDDLRYLTGANLILEGGRVLLP
jgi:NAD(P)-dependent dehydrogenase (short-subunit alcohol dehydrogenase family)